MVAGCQEPSTPPGPPAAPASRCFVGVRPPPRLIERLRDIDRPRRRGLRWTGEEQWHVTLAFFPAVDQEALVMAIDRWSRSPAGLVAAQATTGPAPRVLGGRIWMLPVVGLEELAAALGTATAHLVPDAPGQRDRRFRGHLTLARARHPDALGALAAPDLGATWQVDEVLAFRSELGRHGARHHVIGRWILPPAAADRSGRPTR